MKIDEIMAIAKKKMLKEERCPTTLFMENKQGDALVALLCNFPDAAGQQKQQFLFAFGRHTALAIAPEERQLAKIFLVTEAWVGSYRSAEEAQRYRQASDDPNRKEMLLVQMMDVGDASMSLCSAEILRSGAGVDLLPSKETTPCYSTLLAAFYAGYTSAAMNDEEFAEFIAALQSTTVERLEP